MRRENAYYADEGGIKLVICPKCKKQVSEAAVVCPHCECNIEEFKNNIKAEKERAAAERAEKARLAAEEERKAKELADRLICPDCKTAVTLSDKTCPKCGFPLDDKGERERMKVWRNIQKNTSKPSFKDRWFVPIMIGFFVACIIAYFCIHFSETFGDFLSKLPAIAFFGAIVTALAVIPSFTAANNVKEKNFEEYMIEDENMGADLFAALIKQGMAHCPYCQRRLTEKSITYWGQRPPDVKEIRCEHCGKLIDFPGDRMREKLKQDQINRNWRRRRWGL